MRVVKLGFTTLVIDGPNEWYKFNTLMLSLEKWKILTNRACKLQIYNHIIEFFIKHYVYN